MMIKALSAVLVAVFAVGCAAESGSDENTSSGTADITASTPKNNDDLKSPAPASTSPYASAGQRDAVVDQARKDRLVGEQADGYLGIVSDEEITKDAKAPSDLAARVSNINIQRRTVYTQISVKDGYTVQTVAQTAACELFKSHVVAGEAYETEEGTWEVRAEDLPAKLPSYCN